MSFITRCSYCKHPTISIGAHSCARELSEVFLKSKWELERKLQDIVAKRLTHQDERINKDLEQIRAQISSLEKKLSELSTESKEDESKPSTPRSPTCSQENEECAPQLLKELTTIPVNRVTFAERQVIREPRSKTPITPGSVSTGFTYKIKSSKTRTGSLISDLRISLGDSIIKKPSEGSAKQEDQSELANSEVEPEPTNEAESEPESISDRSPEIMTSNNAHTQCGGPTDRIRLIIEHKDGVIEANANKQMTNKKLYENVRRKLGMEADAKLHLAMLEHRIISEDDKTLWQNQLRNKPNYIVVLPEEIAPGDLMKVKFVEKGENVNSDYVSPIPRYRENRS